MITLIPAYQPSGELLTLVRDLQRARPDHHIVIVDDGSGTDYDRLFAAAAGLGAEVVRYPDNHGKGHALKYGFARICDKYPGHDVVCADADGQHSVADIARVGDEVEEHPGVMVLGARAFTGDVPLRSRVGNNATKWLFRAATGRVLEDTQTGLRGYSASLLGWLGQVQGERYEYELNLLLHSSRAGIEFRIVDISTIYLNDNASSHFRPLVDSARIYLPLLTFSLSSLLAFALDTVALLVLYPMTGSLLAAVIGARAISATINFFTNRHLVFRASGSASLRGAAGRYAGLVLALLAANYLVLASLHTFGLPLLLAKVSTEALMFAASFYIQRRFVFHRRVNPTSDDLTGNAQTWARATPGMSAKVLTNANS